jgi:regulatory protein
MPFRKKNSRPKPVPDEQALYEIAVRALSRTARSTGELRQLLQRRISSSAASSDAQRQAAMADIEAVIARLREHGYLDDARYARSFVASRIDNDRQGRRRVERDLAARRVHPELIQKTVEAAYQDTDERELLRDYLRRKVRLTKPPEKPSAVASLYRRLLRAGFSSATIVKELQGLQQGLPRRGASSRSSVRSSGRSGGRASDRKSGGGSPAVDPEMWRQWVESLADLPEPEDEE